MEVLEVEGILSPDCLWTQGATSALPWVSSLPTCPMELGLASLHNHMSQFLQLISPSRHCYDQFFCALSVSFPYSPTMHLFKK